MNRRVFLRKMATGAVVAPAAIKAIAAAPDTMRMDIPVSYTITHPSFLKWCENEQLSFEMLARFQDQLRRQLAHGLQIPESSLF